MAPQRKIYKEAIVEIYESLYHYQRYRTSEEEQAVVCCINKWYDIHATFENPLVSANGLVAIVHNFSLMSLIPGHTWSELGDVCESEDYRGFYSSLPQRVERFVLTLLFFCGEKVGNRIVVFSHTLHFTLLGAGWAQPPTVSNTPYHSHPPTPFLHTPTVVSAVSSPFTVSRFSNRLQAAATVWPLAFLASKFSPINLIRRSTTFHLTLSTTLRFNEQARIVSHEDRWGIRETIEFLAPAPINAAYGLLRNVLSIAGDSLGRILHPIRTPLGSTNQYQINSHLAPLGLGIDEGLTVASDAYSSD